MLCLARRPSRQLPTATSMPLTRVLQAGAAARAAYSQDPASRYMPHLSLLYSDIPEEERCDRLGLCWRIDQRQ